MSRLSVQLIEMLSYLLIEMLPVQLTIAKYVLSVQLIEVLSDHQL